MNKNQPQVSPSGHSRKRLPKTGLTFADTKIEIKINYFDRTRIQARRSGDSSADQGS